MSSDDLRSAAAETAETVTGRVVALVPAKDRADSVAPTVEALRAIAAIDAVLVIDDGSVDDTQGAALAAGAHVLRLTANRGKAGAVAAGVERCPDAEVFVLIDADLATTAAAADRLLDPVLADEADLVVGVLPPAGGKGGFGGVKRLSAWGVMRGCGATMRAPLSGQRAIRADLLRGMGPAVRFGLEVAMTIDAVRAGARLVEVEVPMDHRHTGRSLAGFAHRGRQGADILRALVPRLVPFGRRVAAIVVVTVLALGAMGLTSTSWVPAGEQLAAPAERVVLFGFGPLRFDDLEQGRTPVLESLLADGSGGALSVRSVSRLSNTTSGWATVGAGARVAVPGVSSAVFGPGDTDPQGSGDPAGQIEARIGLRPEGEIVALGATTALLQNDGPETTSVPGALGAALAGAGLETAVVGNADAPGITSDADILHRPAALAVMDDALAVDHGDVSRDLLRFDPVAPYGVRADADAVMDAVDEALDEADVVVIDPGDLDRADRFVDLALDEALEAQHERAVGRTDALLGRVVEALPPGTLLIVLSVAAPDGHFGITPMAVHGPGVPRGTIVSTSTKRDGVVAITDVATTVLDALGVEAPDELAGAALRYAPGDRVDLDALRVLDERTSLKERTYYAQALLFIALHAVVYIAAIIALWGNGGRTRSAPALRWAALALTAYPVASFLTMGIPRIEALGLGYVSVSVAFAVALGWLASRSSGRLLAGFDALLALTIAVLVLDAASGTRLHLSSWLGYSLSAAGRYYGIPNTTYAVLGAATLLLAAIVVQRSANRRDALAVVAALFVVVVVADGAPSMGGDVGGLITFAPVFLLTWLVLADRPPRVRTVLLLGVGTALLLAGAVAIDLTRPVEARTHLGRFAADVGEDGFGVVIETFLRKQTANFSILRVSIWTWMLPVVAGFLVYLLVIEKRWSGLLPDGSALKHGVVAVPCAALVGFAANDSGPIVIALFVVLLPPTMLLLALDRVDRPPVLSSPDRPVSGGGSPATPSVT